MDEFISSLWATLACTVSNTSGRCGGRLPVGPPTVSPDWWRTGVEADFPLRPSPVSPDWWRAGEEAGFPWGSSPISLNWWMGLGGQEGLLTQRLGQPRGGQDSLPGRPPFVSCIHPPGHPSMLSGPPSWFYHAGEEAFN